MTLDQLRIFIAVADREHLTAAAQALNMTPSAVSHAIRALEERHGAELFHRVGRRIELAEAGKVFLPAAKATLAQAQSAELALAELGGMKRGRLAVHASQTIASYWVPGLLVRFHDAYPGVDVSLAVGNTTEVVRAVIEGGADVGFAEGDVDEPALAMKSVAADQLIVVVSPEHDWSDGRILTPEDLRRARWVMREMGSGTRALFEDALEAIGIPRDELDISLSLPSNEAVRTAVQAGCLAGVMSEMVAASELEAGRLVKAGVDLPARMFWMLWHKERYRTKAAKALESLIPRSR